MLAQRHHTRSMKMPEFVDEFSLTVVEKQLQRLLQARFYGLSQQPEKLRETWLTLVEEARHSQLGLPFLIESRSVVEAWGRLSDDPKRVLPGSEIIAQLGKQIGVNNTELAALPAGLTPKQWLILQRLGEGLSNKQIANLSGISENTVKFHVKGLFKYYAVNKRSQLIQVLQAQIPGQ